MSQQVAYIRVSSIDQNTDRQLDNMKFDRVFNEKASAKDTDRPELQACIAYVRAGDTLHVHSIDRLARSLRDLQSIVDALIAKDVTIKFHAESLVFAGASNPVAELTLQIFGAFAQFERKMSRIRQTEGIEKAKQKGIKLGRKPLSQSIADQVKQLKKDGLSVVDISKQLNLSRPSIYKLLKTLDQSL